MKKLLIILLGLLCVSDALARQTTYVVTSAGDESDPDLEDGVFSPQTFRSAMENANHNPGIDFITFSGVTVIKPTSIYLGFTDQVQVDGSLPNNGRVVFDGGLLGLNNTVAFIVGATADFSSFENLSIVNFSGGAFLIAGDHVTIEDNFIGTSDGVTALANGDPDTPQSSPAILIRGTNASIANNVISGNRGYGIRIDAPHDSTEYEISGNYIGVDSSGTMPLGNVLDGIRSNKGKPFINGNVISSNGGAGIIVSGGFFGELLIDSNLIGVDKTGTSALGNAGSGIIASRGAVVIADNIVSNNLNGIVSSGFGDVIKDNFIGTDITGTVDFGNQFRGVEVSGESSTLGGTKLEDGNLISGNDREGVRVSGFDHLIQNNWIGVNVDGTAALANEREGLELLIGSSTNEIIDNVISGNARDGIELFGENDVTLIRGNYIGTDASGDKAIPNGESGIFVVNAHNVTIGGDFPDESNVISGNGLNGIFAFVTSTVDTLDGIEIINNKVGVDSQGAKAIGNGSVGIWTENNRSIIKNNIVSANFSGIRVDGKNSEIEGNKVGTDITGTMDLGNTRQGIEIRADSNTVGVSGLDATRNIVSGNGTIGIQVNSSDNSIANNFIGTDVTGTKALGNDGDGIEFILFGQNSEVSENVISGNGGEGIDLFNKNRGIDILTNKIGTDVNGLNEIPNEFSGISINNGDDIFIGSPTLDGNGVGNLISGNREFGIAITGQYTDGPLQGVVIKNNFIGTTEIPTSKLSNGDGGIFISEGKKITIGGEFDSDESNIISGNTDVGILIMDLNTSNGLTPDSIEILGNLIGVNGDEDRLGNSDDGIKIEAGSNISIGDDSLKNKNIIANNDGRGINIINGEKVIIGINKIYDNDSLAIDLGGDGVTLNDVDDIDTGPNNLLNFPEITEARYNRDVELLTVFGRLDTKPEIANYFVDLYFNDACYSNGTGDATSFLGTLNLTTDASGFAQFTKEFTVKESDISDFDDGIGVTAINTKEGVASSEISRCFLIPAQDTLQGKPDLLITKTDSLENIQGSNNMAAFTYTIKVKNIGQVRAREVVMTDTIPNPLIIGDFTTTNGTINLNERALSLEIDSLAAGDSVIVRIPVQANLSGMIINKAQVTSSDEESNLSNNMAADTTDVLIQVSNEPGSNLPTEYELKQNYPNPFNPTTTISYSVPQSGFVELSIYNILGVKIETLTSEVKAAGIHSVTWDASPYSSNIYFYRIRVGNFVAIKKMTLIK